MANNTLGETAENAPPSADDSASMTRNAVEAIEHASEWIRVKDKVDTYRPIIKQETDNIPADVTSSMLGAIDPRLPSVMRHMLQDRDDIVSGAALRNVLQFFSSQVLVFSIGKTPMDVYISNICDMGAELLAGLPRWRISADIYEIGTTDDGLVYGFSSYRTNSYVQEAELDSRHPDWRTRLQVAQGLGLEPEELAQYTLGLSHAPLLEMPSMSPGSDH